MKKLALALSVLLLPFWSQGASKPEPLAELIARVAEDGEPQIVKGAMDRELGLSAGEVERSIRIRHSESSDHEDHIFSVIVRPAPDGHAVPEVLKVGLASGKSQKDGIFVDGFIFEADLKGNLLMAFHNSGIAPHVKSERIPIDKRKTQKIFEKELGLFLAGKK